MNSKNNFITIESQIRQNIHPIKLKDSKEHLSALTNLRTSLTGRLDVMFSNTFINEAVQLIINAIALFEDGYFDASFYSLRESLEISTTTIYFVDDSEENRKASIKNWKKQGKFPGHKQMIKELNARAGTFADIREKMQSYFQDIEGIKKKLDKYVHKQGFDKFYVVRNNPFKTNNYSEEILSSDFELFLTKSISAIAVFRLAIDPLPILLIDEDIYNRTGQFLTEGYGDNFIKKYISNKNVEEYKKTDIYIQHYDALIRNEEMLPSVVDLVKDEYIDRNKIDEILSQKHLIPIDGLIATILISRSSKITKVYCYGGISWYFTNIKSNRKNMSWNSSDFTLEKIGQNTPYDECFLTRFNVYDEDYYVEHNEVFNQKELVNLNHEIRNINSEIVKLDQQLLKRYPIKTDN